MGGGLTRKELFNVGSDRNASTRHAPCDTAAFTVEPWHCHLSVTAAVSSISFHNLESSPELTYRAVVEHHFRQEEWMILVNCSLVDPCTNRLC